MIFFLFVSHNLLAKQLQFPEFHFHAQQHWGKGTKESNETNNFMTISVFRVDWQTTTNQLQNFP